MPAPAISTQEEIASLLELQLNAEFWQLLSTEELISLSELRSTAINVERVIPLEYLYPGFHHIESIDSRDQQGQLLEIFFKEKQSLALKNSYLKLEPSGQLTLFLEDRAVQKNPQQLNIYGETWPKIKLQFWLEEDFEHPFLLSELEIYQRFHNVQIEVQVIKNLKQAISHSLHDGGRGPFLPDMILADRKTTEELRDQLERWLPKRDNGQTPKSKGLKDPFHSLAFLDLFVSNGQYYSMPFALETYSLLYNPKLLSDKNKEDSENSNRYRNLSQFFTQLAKQRTKYKREQSMKQNPYVLAFGENTLPFSLLLYSFLDDHYELSNDNLELRQGLQYLREQSQKELLVQLDFIEERFANGHIAAIIARSGDLPRIMALANSNTPIKIAKLPFNDICNNDITPYSRIWGLSILRQSASKPQATVLRNYLLSGGLQGQFDLSQGVLPVNTIYYPFYQRSLYYHLLPKASLRHTMKPKELWEYGIEQRSIYQNIEELDRLFRSRISIVLNSDTELKTILEGLKQQLNETILRKQPLFLR